MQFICCNACMLYKSTSPIMLKDMILAHESEKTKTLSFSNVLPKDHKLMIEY